MTTNPTLQDPESAREHGETVGREIGQRTAFAMLRTDLAGADLGRIGAEAVASIMAQADAMADAGAERSLVSAWTEGAADAFHAEMERAATLLKAREASASLH